MEETKKETDEDIVIRYRNGQTEAFKELITKYSSPLYNFTARLTDKTNAADIVQETFIKAWKHIPRFDPQKASFKTWIFTIAKNTTTDFLRKKKAVTFSSLESGRDEDVDSFVEKLPDEYPLPDEVMMKLDDAAFLYEALYKLKPEYREVLLLHYQEAMTFDEIGKVLGKPLNTVKSMHYRAIRLLRAYADNAPKR